MSTNTIDRAELNLQLPNFSAEQTSASNKMYAEVGPHGSGEGCGHGDKHVLQKLSEILEPSKKTDVEALGFGKCTIEDPTGAGSSSASARHDQMESHKSMGPTELTKEAHTPAPQDDTCGKSSLQKLEQKN